MNSNVIFFNRCFDKKRLKSLILWSVMNVGEEATIKIVEKLKNLGFHFATQAGISLGLDDLKTPITKSWLVSQAEKQIKLTEQEYQRGNLTAVEEFQFLVDTWHRTSEILKDNVISSFQSDDPFNPVYMMAFSGARGNISQVRQLTGMRGLMADPQGQIIGFPIQSNFREGLTLTEYMISCYGARKGLVDTALRTADAGYLTRRLVDVSQHIIVKTATCTTQKGIFLKDIKASGKVILSLKDRLLGRVLAEDIPNVASRNQEISIDLIPKIISQKQKILVRSPLTCSIDHGVCQLCYGWSLSQRKLVTLGEAVGIIAAQSIGEPGTQLTMRTFHTGGVFSGDIMDEIRAPAHGIINFPFPLQGMLIRTSHGKIAFLTKMEGIMILDLFASLMQKDISIETNKFREEKQDKNNLNISKNRDFLNLSSSSSSKRQDIQFHLKAATVLFVRQHEKIDQNQLLAEYSSIGTQINERIEAKKTVFSELSGQIYFVNVVLGKQMEEYGVQQQISKNLGAIWILSSKKLQTNNFLNLFDKGCHLINETSLISRTLIKTPSAFLTKNKFSFSDYYFQIIKRNFLALKTRNIIYKYNVGYFSSNTKGVRVLRLETKKDFTSHTSHASYNGLVPKTTNFLNSLLKEQKLKNQESFVKTKKNTENNFQEKIELPVINQLEKEKQNDALKEVQNEVHTIFYPIQYQTKMSGIFWIEQGYFNEVKNYGEIFYIPQENYNLNFNQIFSLVFQRNNLIQSKKYHSVKIKTTEKWKTNGLPLLLKQNLQGKIDPFFLIFTSWTQFLFSSKNIIEKQTVSKNKCQRNCITKNFSSINKINKSANNALLNNALLLGQTEKLTNIIQPTTSNIEIVTTKNLNQLFPSKTYNFYFTFNPFILIDQTKKSLVYPHDFYRRQEKKFLLDLKKHFILSPKYPFPVLTQKIFDKKNLEKNYTNHSLLLEHDSINTSSVDEMFKSEKMGSIKIQTKTGWIYFPQNSIEALSFHQLFFVIDVPKLENIQFNQSPIYSECLIPSPFLYKTKNIKKLFDKNWKITNKILTIIEKKKFIYFSKLEEKISIFKNQASKEKYTIDSKNYKFKNSIIFVHSKNDSLLQSVDSFTRKKNASIINTGCASKMQRIMTDSSNLSIQKLKTSKTLLFLMRQVFLLESQNYKKNKFFFKGQQKINKIIEISDSSFFLNPLIWLKNFTPQIRIITNLKNHWSTIKINYNVANNFEFPTTRKIFWSGNVLFENKNIKKRENIEMVSTKLKSQESQDQLSYHFYFFPWRLDQLAKTRPLFGKSYLHIAKKPSKNFILLIQKIDKFPILPQHKNQMLNKNTFFSTKEKQKEKQFKTSLTSFPWNYSTNLPYSNQILEKNNFNESFQFWLFKFKKFKKYLNKQDQSKLVSLFPSIVIEHISLLTLQISKKIHYYKPIHLLKIVTNFNEHFNKEFFSSSSFSPLTETDNLKKIKQTKLNTKKMHFFRSDVEAELIKPSWLSILSHNQLLVPISTKYKSWMQEDAKRCKKMQGMTLTNFDQITYLLPYTENKKNQLVYVGQFINYGQEIAEGIGTLHSGQIINIEKQKITLRQAQAVLFYSNGISHVLHGQWVEKGSPILTLTYQRLVTGDIVQGIPKIEQFFEAPSSREGENVADNLQVKLNKSFQRFKKQFPLPLAVRKSLKQIQQYLVEGIQKVYLSQGVLIADKHLEVIVRQMTSKIKVIDAGDTGLFKGEYVSLDKIESINIATYGQKADYEPTVLGITQASLNSESFISAASFQETTRVLSRDTIIGKTDFLRGLKERVILGDLIQAGTGLDDNIIYGLMLSKQKPLLFTM